MDENRFNLAMAAILVCGLLIFARSCQTFTINKELIDAGCVKTEIVAEDSTGD